MSSTKVGSVKALIQASILFGTVLTTQDTFECELLVIHCLRIFWLYFHMKLSLFVVNILWLCPWFCVFNSYLSVYLVIFKRY